MKKKLGPEKGVRERWGEIERDRHYPNYSAHTHTHTQPNVDDRRTKSLHHYNHRHTTCIPFFSPHIILYNYFFRIFFFFSLRRCFHSCSLLSAADVMFSYAHCTRTHEPTN